MPGDILDPCWVYQHTKGHVLIPSHLVETSVRLLYVPSNVPKTGRSVKTRKLETFLLVHYGKKVSAELDLRGRKHNVDCL